MVQGMAKDKVMGVGWGTRQSPNKDKDMGVGWGTRQSPRQLSCLLSRTYQTGCDGCDDSGGPRSNAVDWATQVSQQSKGRGGAGKEGPLTWVLYETQIK